jgi:hypothetical protein
MKKRLYIELLEAEVTRLKERIGEQAYEINQLKDEVDPTRKHIRNMAKNMEKQMFNGLDSLIQGSATKTLLEADAMLEGPKEEIK